MRNFQFHTTSFSLLKRLPNLEGSANITRLFFFVNVLLYFTTITTMAQVEQQPVFFQHPLLHQGQSLHEERKYEEAEKVIDEGLEKFHQEKNHRNFAEALFLKGKVTMHQYRIDESLEWYDSSANYAQLHNLNYHYVSALGAQASILNYQNQSDSVVSKCRKILAVQGQPIIEYSDAYGALTTAYLAKGVVDSADKYTWLAYRTDSLHNIEKRLYNSTGRLGKMYARKGDNEKAITLYLRSLELSPSDRPMTKIKANFNLSNAFFQIHNLKKAKSYAQEVLELAGSNNLKSAQHMALSQLGDIAAAANQPQLSIEYYRKALQHFKSSKNKKMRARGHLGLAKSFLTLNQLDSAQVVITKVQAEIEDSDNDQMKLKYLVAESLYDLKKGNYSATKKHLDEAIIKAKALENLFSQREIYKIYADYYQAIGKPDLAFENLEKHYWMKDSLNQMQQQYTVHDLEAQYQKMEQDAKILKLDNEKSLMNQKLSRRNIAIGLGSLLLFITSLGCYLIYFFYKKNKEKSKELSLNNQQLSKALKEKEFLVKEIHHRVKNNLQVVSSLLSLQARNIQDPKALDALKEGQSRVRSMALIHQNLYQEDDLIGVEVKSYIEKLSEGLFQSYKVDHDRIQLFSDIDEVTLDVETIIPLGLIINELITNALKYAFEENSKGNINLSLKKEKDQLIFSIVDNGKGLPPNFSLEKSKTLGYRLIKAFSQKLEAALKVEGGNGTRVSLTIPS